MPMSNVRMIGCLHLGHTSVAKYRGWDNAEEQDAYLIKQWNKVVNKKDTTYIIGDITMEKKLDYYKLDMLNGRKIVVGGNHDLHKHSKQLMLYVDGMAGAVDYKGFILTHVPIHPNEVQFYRGNIHAHIHHLNRLEEVVVNDRYDDEGSKPAPTLHKYFNVDAHLLDYTPISIEDLLNSDRYSKIRNL
jgi:calcineurin-like phosphoesterase family protein